MDLCFQRVHKIRCMYSWMVLVKYLVTSTVGGCYLRGEHFEINLAKNWVGNATDYVASWMNLENRRGERMMGINAQRNGVTVKNSILGEKNVTG